MTQPNEASLSHQLDLFTRCTSPSCDSGVSIYFGEALDSARGERACAVVGVAATQTGRLSTQRASVDKRNQSFLVVLSAQKSSSLMSCRAEH